MIPRRRRSPLLHLVPTPRPLKASLPTVLRTMNRITAKLEQIALYAPDELATVETAVDYVQDCLLDALPTRQFR